MTEEEIIRYCKALIEDMKMHHDVDNEVYIHENDYKAIEGLLNLYYKQKEDIMYLRTDAQDLADDVEFWQNRCDNSIDKDEILKALGYEENDEEYKRIYNKEELILSLIHTINAECDRLEDIEDKKIMLEEHNIENMRDKYWQDKIRDKIKEYREQRIKLADGHFFDNPDNTSNDFALFIGQEVLKQLLEEK